MAEYYFNELDHTKFQRLINAILTAHFGVNIRITPLRGQDGGRDGETSVNNPYFEFNADASHSFIHPFVSNFAAGRYLFQSKHHRTTDKRISDVRKKVVQDFRDELIQNVLTRTNAHRVNYFFLVTNVPSSKSSLALLDEVRSELLKGISYLHADIWWQEQVTAYLDQLPRVWSAFPELFSGKQVPLLGKIASSEIGGHPRTIRLALERQYSRDSLIKFRQIDLERDLAKLFVDLDLTTENLPVAIREELVRLCAVQQDDFGEIDANVDYVDAESMRIGHYSVHYLSALDFLFQEGGQFNKKILIEGGPGQGKSTLTQMASQIYRAKLLNETEALPEQRWKPPKKSRLPFRIELRRYSEALAKNNSLSVEEFLATHIAQDAGGANFNVDDLQSTVTNNPIILIFDGLDEIGNDSLRDSTLEQIEACITRMEKGLQSDLRVVITTRPPAIVGHMDRLKSFIRLPVAPLSRRRMHAYVNRWLEVQGRDVEEREHIRNAFISRLHESHVRALAKNPMQLSVLLHFIRLKGEAFPDRRADLYKDYFSIVIDRDVEKSPDFRTKRDVIEHLHRFIGYKIHSLTEARQADGTLERDKLLELVRDWLSKRGHESKEAEELFRLGEERLGLIVALKGEAEETRYGYEIQPIREYFAGAYINDHVVGEAHQIFTEMVRRPFWKEVSLFLAGLRRPNEKADLISRARELDSDIKEGWRQDGRIIILELLEEGIFHQPPHLLIEALSFVLEALDVKVVPASRDIPAFSYRLGNLIRSSNAKRIKDKINLLIDENKNSNDMGVIFRTYYIAAQIFDKQELLSRLPEWKSEEKLTFLRLSLFPAWGIDIRDLSKQSWFWKGVSKQSAVKYWFMNVQSSPELVTISAPSELHPYLIDELATTPNPFGIRYSGKRRRRNSCITLGPKPWAAWALFGCLDALSICTSNKAKKSSQVANDDEYTKSVIQLLIDIGDVQYDGLDRQSASDLKSLLTFLRSVMQLLVSDKSADTEILHQYSETLKELIERPGAIGWLSWKVARMSIYFLFQDENTRSAESLTDVLSRLEQSLIPGSNTESLYVSLMELQTGKPNKKRQKKSNKSKNEDVFTWYQVPRFLRVEGNKRLVDSDILLARIMLKGSKYSPEFFKNMTIAKISVFRILNMKKVPLPKILSFVSKRNISEIGSIGKLHVSQVQRILRCVRQTDDDEIRKGALILLRYTRFIKIAGEDLTLALMRGANDRSELIENLFINALYPYDEEYSVAEKEILVHIAVRILENSGSWSFSVVASAAEYLSETVPINLPPIIQQEAVLRIS